MIKQKRSSSAFTLAEVVVALGIVAFAIVAILGLMPVGLATGRSAQDESRAPQIAQDIINSIASQVQSRYPNVTIKQTATNFSYDIDLSQSTTHKWMSADNDGTLAIVDPTRPAEEIRHPYQILISITPDPPGFDKGYASQVALRIVTPPSLNPDSTPAPNQTVRDFVRIFSKY
ncbi:MAG: hypothetical protein ACJ8M1_11225 [Chthoniobacterales bacterium]